jgi:Flp pilus assembly protein TadD
VLASDPGNPAALNDLGMAQIQLEKYPQATATLRQATERTPQDSRVWNNLGLAARRAGDLPLARQAYTRSAELDPTFAVPCYNRATLELDAGDKAEATRWLDEALRRAPGMPEAKALRSKL